MKNKKLLSMLALTVMVSMVLPGCGASKEKEEVVVEESTFPEVEEKEEKKEEAKEETAAPDAQTTTYLSKDKTISIQLPDATWANKADETDLLTFDSPEQGNIVITHTTEAEELPDTQENALALEQAGGLAADKDFELQNYAAETDENGNSVYSYQLKSKDSDALGCAYMLVKVFANETESYTVRAAVNSEEDAVLAGISASVESIGITADSGLSAVAPMTIQVPKKEKKPAKEKAEKKEEAPAEETAAPEKEADAPAPVQGIAPSRDNPNNSDTSATRTIYRNSDGHPLVISADANGNWVDEDGNSYRFTNECDVYDQNDVDYYWHGEAADVYYMPVQ